MPIFWSFFGILHTISIILMAIGLYRLYSYIRQYQFDESQYTLLFGFVHLRWIAWLFGIFTVLWVLISIFILRLP